MIKYFCDKCGKELFWNGQVTLNNTYANTNIMAQQFNTDGYKTYDALSGQWLDLCMECKMELQSSKKFDFGKFKDAYRY